MIKNFEHATAVQLRRYNLKKKGIARAVRRWMKQKGIEKSSVSYSKLRSIANFAGCNENPPARAIVMHANEVLGQDIIFNDRLAHMSGLNKQRGN